LCSAHRLRTVASCPCFSDSPVSFSPSQRTSVHPQDPLLHILEPTLPPRALVLLRSSAVEGRERARMCDFPTAGSKGCHGLCSTTLEGPWGLRLRGACRGSKEDPPSRQALSLKCLDSASCQSSGVCHLLPATCLSAACPLATPAQGQSLALSAPPRLAPRPPPLASLRLPEEGRTRFLLLVLTPL